MTANDQRPAALPKLIIWPIFWLVLMLTAGTYLSLRIHSGLNFDSSILKFCQTPNNHRWPSKPAIS
jgi:hypothetical protein